MRNRVGDCYQEAFGEFDPQGDHFFAAKLAVSVLAMEGRFDDLANLLTEGHAVGAVEGCPGWTIERRDSNVIKVVGGYDEWPKGKSYRAYVDPDEFSLAHPEVFLDAKVLNNYVEQVVIFYSRNEKSIPYSLLRVQALIASKNAVALSCRPQP